MAHPHPSSARLAAALELLNPGVKADPTVIAEALGESAQTITNWRSRGVSTLGAISAQRLHGISCTWILDGTQPALVGQSQPARLTGEMIRLAYREAREMAAQGGAEAGDFDPGEQADDAGILAVMLNRALLAAGKISNAEEGDESSRHRRAG